MNSTRSKSCAGGVDLINRGQVGIDEAVVGGEGLHEVLVVPDQVSHEPLGFLRHRHCQLAAEQGEHAAVARRGHNAVEAQPLRHELIEPLLGLRISQHPPGYALETLGSTQTRRGLRSSSSAWSGIVFQRE